MIVEPLSTIIIGGKYAIILFYTCKINVNPLQMLIADFAYLCIRTTVQIFNIILYLLL